jgi:putative hemolysin
MIHASPEFRDCSIPLDPFGLSDDPRFNIRGFMAAKRHLHDNGIIGGFPAGRVAPCYGPNAMPCDSRWSPHLVRLARLTGAGVLIASFSLSSGRLLRFLPASIPHLRGLFLAREALRPAHRRQIAVRVATAPETSGLSDEETTAVLQRFCHEHLHS